MSQLTIKLSDKADALIAQLQKEIFNRRRKKISAAGVVETLVESGAKSQSDKRFATSWKNLIADIEKAAKLANAHGAKPANLSDEEWAMVLSHRSRAAQPLSSAQGGTSATAGRTRPRKKATGNASTTVRTRSRSSAASPQARRMDKAVSQRRKAALVEAPSANGASPELSEATG
jgi:hypothetical protein